MMHRKGKGRGRRGYLRRPPAQRPIFGGAARILMAIAAAILAFQGLLGAPLSAAKQAFALEGQQSPSLVTGTCHVTAPDPTSTDNSNEFIIMPDGARLHALCWQRDHEHLPDHVKYSWPAEGDYTFHTELNEDGSFMVIAETKDAKPYSDVIYPGYPCQTIYAEKWRPKIEIKFQKKSSEPSISVGPYYEFAGAKYEIFDGDGKKRIGVITFDKNGEAHYDLPIGREYILREIEAPQGFQIDKNDIRFKAIMNGMLVKLEEEPQDLTFTVIKQDSAAGEQAQDTLTLAGAEFTLVDCKGEAHTAVTDEEGYARFTGLPLGDVTYFESKAPIGYALCDEKFTHHIDATDLSDMGKDGTLYVYADAPVPNRPYAFDVEISKFKRADEDTGGVMRPAEGVEFEIISKTTGKTLTTITTDKYGTARTPEGEWYGAGERNIAIKGSLPFDPKGYIVRENPNTVPSGYVPMDDFIISPEEQVDGVRLKYIVENKMPSSHLQIIKTDKASGQRVPLSGFTFELLDKNKKPIKQECWHPQHVELTRFTTDQSGSVTLPQQLVPGTYYIREVASVGPYLTAKTCLKLVIDNGKGVASVTFSDDQAMGQAVIEKLCSEDGESLAGAEFDVIAQEDIVSPDGRVAAVKGSVVDHVKTDEKGKATTKKLALGSGSATYAFVETRAPVGHALDATPIPFTLTYKGGEHETVKQHVMAKNTPTKIIVDKTDSSSGAPLPGAHFSASRVSDDGTEGEPLEAITDEEGRAVFNHIKPGLYRLRETQAPTGYLIDNGITEITVDEQGLIDSSPTGTVKKTNGFTRVDISKRSAADESEIPGAKLKLTNSRGEVIAEWVSDKKPHRVEHIDPGTYTLEERMTPLGFDQAQSITFDVKPTGVVQSFALYDEPISIDAQLDKRQQIAAPINDKAEADTKENGAKPAKSDGYFDYALDFRSLSSTWTDEFNITDTLQCVRDGKAELLGITTPRAQGDYDGKLNIWYTTSAMEASKNTEHAEGGANATLDDGHANPWLSDPLITELVGDDGRAADYTNWMLWERGVDATEPHLMDVRDLNLEKDEHVTGIRLEFGRVDKGFTTGGTDWNRKGMKDLHDNYLGSDETQRVGSALLHMRATDQYDANSRMSNGAYVEANRNGGGNENLHGEDVDQVEQQAKDKPLPLFPLVPGITNTPCPGSTECPEPPKAEQNSRPLAQTGSIAAVIPLACGLGAGAAIVGYTHLRNRQ